MPDPIPNLTDLNPSEPLDTESRRQLAASVAQDYQQWKQSRARLEQKWQECWEAYLCDVKALHTQRDAHPADFSQIARPVLYEAVETIHSNLLNALFPANERFFTVMGETESDHAQAELIAEFLRSKLEDIGFIEKYALFLKQAIITGNTVAAVPWRQIQQTRRVNQPIELFGITVGYQKVLREEITYSGPDFEVLDIFDFLVDPNATRFEHAKVIRRVERSLRDLKSNPAYTHLEEIEPNAKPDSQLNETNKNARRRLFGLDTEVLNTVAPNQAAIADKVEVLEAWGDFVVGENIYRNYVCTVANRTTVIRFEPNPYDCGMKPFVFTNFIPVPNEIYGISAIEKSLGLQHAINTLTNQKLDIINLSINAPFTYLINDDVFDPEMMVTRPGALIPVKSHDTLRPIEYLNNFTVAFTEIADLKMEIQEATGALRYFNGGDSSGARTATEVSALLNGGTQKFSSFISHLEHTSLEPFLQIIFENAQQFILEPQELRVTYQDGHLGFKKIMPNLLKNAKCRFRIDGSRGMLIQAQEMQSISSFLRLVEDSPALRNQVNLMALYKKIYRRLGFHDESEIFLPSSEKNPLPTDASNATPSS